MLIDFRTVWNTPNNSVSRKVWVGSRLGGLLVGVLLIVALFLMTPPESIAEAPAIQAVSVNTVEIERPVTRPPATDIAKTREPSPPQVPQVSPIPAVTTQVPNPDATSQVKRPIPLDRPTPTRGPSTSTTQNSVVVTPPSTTPPRIASASAGSTVASGPPNETKAAGETTTKLKTSTLSLLRIRECARLDIADRPADCPPNAELMRLLAQERGPQYRPENADGFSRNELAWRGIPPPCLKDGQNFSVSGAGACVRFGSVPSRVRTVKEICEARGLGGCADAPSQAAVNAALEQVRRSQATKSVP